MEKRSYQKVFSCWWASLETETDNSRVNPALFRKVSPNNDLPRKSVSLKSEGPKKKEIVPKPNIPKTENILPVLTFEKSVKNCYIIKEAMQKLKYFLSASHKSGCSDPNCVYDDSIYKLKVLLKNKVAEVKVPAKRGRKPKSLHGQA